MQDEQSILEQQLIKLKEGFDQTFTQPAGALRSSQESLLAITAGSHRLALRLSELTGFQLCGKIMPLAGQAPPLLGISGIRGRVVPIFDLAHLLWGQEDGQELRWVALCGSEQGMGLAFAGFDGYLRVDRTQLRQMIEGEGSHLPEVLQTEGLVRGVVSVKSILIELAKRLDGAPKKGSRNA